jgi:hypothetical protein
MVCAGLSKQGKFHATLANFQPFEGNEEKRFHKDVDCRILRTGRNNPTNGKIGMICRIEIVGTAGLQNTSMFGYKTRKAVPVRNGFIGLLNYPQLAIVRR